MNARKLMDTARTLIAADKGLLASFRQLNPHVMR